MLVCNLFRSGQLFHATSGALVQWTMYTCVESFCLVAVYVGLTLGKQTGRFCSRLCIVRRCASHRVSSFLSPDAATYLSDSRDYWQYYEPIRQYMPKNCSTDVQAVIKHVDKVFKGSDLQAIEDVKKNFNLTSLTHVDDVAASRECHFLRVRSDLSYHSPTPVRNIMWYWRRLENDRTFYSFCDALEVKNGEAAGLHGWGVDHALAAWGKFWKEGFLQKSKSILLPVFFRADICCWNDSMR